MSDWDALLLILRSLASEEADRRYAFECLGMNEFIAEPKASKASESPALTPKEKP